MLDIDEKITDKKLLNEFKSKKDYEKIVIPFLEKSKQNGSNVDVGELSKIVHDAHTVPFSSFFDGTSDKFIDKNLNTAHNKILKK